MWIFRHLTTAAAVSRLVFRQEKPAVAEESENLEDNLQTAPIEMGAVLWHRRLGWRVGQQAHFRRTPSVTAYRVEFGSLSGRH